MASLQDKIKDRKIFLDELNSNIDRDINSLRKSDLCKEFLGYSYKRVIFNTYKKDGKSKDYGSSLLHISDWIEAAIVNNAPWISNLDELGRPKKLMKFASIEQIVQEADRDMLVMAQQHKNIVLNNDDEVIYKILNEDYYIVRLLTPAALDRESSQMQHCIGQGAYDKNLNDGKTLLLSLRDSFNKPHVTMEIYEGEIEQIQGKQNEVPIKKYMDLVISFIKEEKLKILEATPELPYISDNNGEIHNIFDLPDELDIENFYYVDSAFIDETLNIDHAEIITIPKKLINTKKIAIRGARLNGTFNQINETPYVYLDEVKFLDFQETIKNQGELRFSNIYFISPPKNIEGEKVSFLSSNEESWPLKIKVNKLLMSGKMPDFLIKIDATELSFNFGMYVNDIVHDINAKTTNVTMSSGHKFKIPAGVKTETLHISSYTGNILSDVMPVFPKVSGVIDVDFQEYYIFPDYLSDETKIVFGSAKDTITLGEYRQQNIPAMKF